MILKNSIVIFLGCRYLKHLAKLIDATHMLCSSHIPHHKINEAEQLLYSFCDDFEILYGESNTVFNVHLLRHLAECVRNIGPLFAYSNYHFEDQIGHLVALHKGTTDVAMQICEKYLLERNLFKFIAKSPIAKKFSEEIDGKKKYSIVRKVEESVVIGNVKKHSELSQQEKSFIVHSFNDIHDIQIEEYGSVLLNSKIFYEKCNKKQKRTSDSFVLCSDNGNFGQIISIFVIQSKLYFLVDEKFKVIINPKNSCQSLFYLKESNRMNLRVVDPRYISSKFVFIEFDKTLACSKFPNLFERN